MLAERPMHGYELISELEERTGGRWRPSPGSVYPTLAQLEDEGLVRAVDDDGKKRYELTDAGRTWLDEHEDDEQTMPWERAASGRRGDLRRLAGEIFGQLRQLGRYGSPAQLDKAKEILGPHPRRAVRRARRHRRPRRVIAAVVFCPRSVAAPCARNSDLSVGSGRRRSRSSG